MKTKNYSEKNQIICEKYAFDSEFLVRLSTITKGPLLERRMQIRKSLVLATLSNYQPGLSFKVGELAKGITNLTKCTLNEEDIISVLNQLEKEAIIRHLSGLQYIIEKKIEIPKFKQVTQPAWDEFVIYLKEQYLDYDPFIDIDSRKIFDNIILKLLSRFTVSSNTLKNQIESLPFEDFKLVIKKEIGKSSLSRNFRKRYPDILHFYFTSNPSNLLTLIFDSYSSIINIDLIFREQDMDIVNFLNELKFLLLDTTFLVTLLCKTDPAHPLAMAVVKQCKKRNIKLYYTYKTKKELWSFITASKYEMSGFSASSGHEIIRGQFVQDFRRQRISWYDYIAIIDSWEHLIKNQWDITQIKEPLKIDDDVFDYVKKTLRILDYSRNEDRMRNDPNYKPQTRDDPQYEHDAYCIALIAQNRKSLETKHSPEPIGPWFLTFDNLVSTLNAAYLGNKVNLGYVIQPRSILNYFLVYSKIEFEKTDREAVAESILKFTARSPEPKVTIEEYIRLINYKMGLEDVDIEIVKEIFLASPLRKELEKALKLDLGEEADKIAYKIITDTTFIETIIGERKMRSKLRKASEKLRIVTKELDEERAAKEALQQTLKQGVYIKTEVVTHIDLNIMNDFYNLIFSLEAENAFKDGILEKPSDISTKEKIKQWLEKAKTTIETSKNISDRIRNYLPIIVILLRELSDKINM